MEVNIATFENIGFKKIVFSRIHFNNSNRGSISVNGPTELILTALIFFVSAPTE